MSEKTNRLSNMNKPVPMKLFAAWEVDRTASNCIPSMFKIVQTVEQNKKQLTIVPYAWETNGQLRWPKRRADELIKTNSIPEANWFEMKCKLKRNYLITYDIAEEELNRMLDPDDSDDNEYHSNGKEKRCKVVKEKYFTEPTTSTSCHIHNQNFQQPGCSNVHSNYSVKVLNPTSSPSPPTNDTLLLDDANQLNNMEQFKMILKNQNNILLNQKNIIEYLRIINGNYYPISQRLDNFETILDQIVCNNSYSKASECRGVNQLPQSSPPHSINESLLTIKPIDSLDELNVFEKKLEDKQTMDKYIDQLTYICGRKTNNGQGLNNCFRLVDKLFTRKFMTLCSWAGGARDKREKIPFKIYKHIIELFFKIILWSDNEFTVKKCEQFFKNVIRNSTRRSQTNFNRLSTTKRRPTKLSYQMKHQDDAVNENSDTSIDPLDEWIPEIKYIVTELERSPRCNK